MSTAESAVVGGAGRLLDCVSRSRKGLALRVWATDGNGDWRLLHAAGNAAGNGGDAAAHDLSAPSPDTKRHRIQAGGSAALELEVAGGRLEGAELSFLTTALAELLAREREANDTARELAERYEEIDLLYSISEILGSVVSLEEAARMILSEVADVMGARRASLWVHDPADGSLHLAAAVGEAGMAGPVPVDDPESVTARVFRERQILNLERGTVLPRSSRPDPKPRGTDAFLSVPINYTPPAQAGETRAVGVITLVGRPTAEPFSAGDTRLLAAVANQVGAALETQRLFRQSLNRERLDRELELAHDLQLKLLPDSAELAELGDIAARCVPADSVGGDLYRFFRLPEGKLGVMVGDVSSHGFSAALIMAMTMSVAGIYGQQGGSPAEVLRRIHAALIDELEATEMHLALFYAVIEPEAGQLAFANAGHPHAFILGDDGAATRLAATSPPLGTNPHDVFREEPAEWRAGRDLLFVFTDGLADAFAGRRGTTSQGEAALIDRIVALRDRPSAEVLHQVFRGLRASPAGVPADDRTAVLVRG